MHNSTSIPTPLTYEVLMASIYENDRFIKEKFAESDRFLTEKFAESDRFLTEKFAETDRQMKETDKKIAETDRQMKETDKQIAENDRSIWKKFAETDRKIKETDRQMKENDRSIWKKFAETDRQRKENDRFLTEKFAKTDRFLTEKFAKTDRLIKANSQDIGGISKSNGQIAETYFCSCFENYPHFAGQEYQTVDRNMKRFDKTIDLKDEYDLVLCNGTSVVIIEVKYNAKKRDVEQTLKKADTFKQLFPQYKEFTFYLGLAGFNFEEEAEQDAIAQGIAVIKKKGRRLAINDAHLKTF
jgi:hypothetical protein